jgi:hypothetical protein
VYLVLQPPSWVTDEEIHFVMLGLFDGRMWEDFRRESLIPECVEVIVSAEAA